MKKTGIIAAILAALMLFSIGCNKTDSGIDSGNDSSSTPAKETFVVIATAKEHGSVTGGGTYEKDSSATLTATADAGYELEGWYSNGDKVTTETSFTVTVTEHVAYYATFRQQNALELADYTSGRISGATFAFIDRTEEDHNYDGLASLEEGTYFSGLQSDKKVNGSDNAYAIKVDAMDPDGDGVGRYPADAAWDTWNRINNWLRLDLAFDKAKDISTSLITVDVYCDNFSYALGFNVADDDFSEESTVKAGEKWLSLIDGQNGNGGPEAFLDYIKVTDIGNGWKRVSLNPAGIYENATVLESAKYIRFIVTLQNYGVDTANAHTLDYTQNSAIYFDNFNITEVEEPTAEEDITASATTVLKNATVSGATAKSIVKTNVFATSQEAAYITSDGTEDLVVTVPLGCEFKVNNISLSAYVFDEDNTAPSINVAIGSGEGQKKDVTVIGWKKVSAEVSGSTESVTISFGKIKGYVLLSDFVVSASEQTIVYKGGEKSFGGNEVYNVNNVVDEYVIAEGVTKVNYTITLNISGDAADDSAAYLRKIELFSNGTLWSAKGIQLAIRGDILHVYTHKNWDSEIGNTWNEITIPKGEDIKLTVSVEYVGENTIVTLTRILDNDTTQTKSFTVEGKVNLGDKTVAAYCPADCILTIK